MEPEPNGAAPGPVQQELAPRGLQRYRARLFQLYLILSLVVFTALALLTSTRAALPVDVGLTLALQRFNPLWFDRLMRLVSWPGFLPQVIFVIALPVFGLYAARLRRAALYLALAGLSSHAVNFVLKAAFQRPRPSQDLVEVARQISGFSFPSGHVMFYVIFFGFLGFLAYTLLRRSWWRWLLLGLCAGLVLLVGPSRIYLGQHWGSDVLGAYLMGSLVLTSVIWLYRRYLPPAPASQV